MAKAYVIVKPAYTEDTVKLYFCGPVAGQVLNFGNRQEHAHRFSKQSDAVTVRDAMRILNLEDPERPYVVQEVS